MAKNKPLNAELILQLSLSVSAFLIIVPNR